MFRFAFAPCAWLIFSVTPLSAAEPAPQKLFDGRTLDGWKTVKENAYAEPGPPLFRKWGPRTRS